jgi:hypothetical protein
MKRLMLALSIAAVVALLIAATAMATITGKYRATITKPASVNATWTLAFQSNGSVVIERNGQATANHGSVKGSTFTAPGGKLCPTVGTYKIKVTANKLTFLVIKDTCKVGRKLILPGHTWTKVG